MKNIVKKTLKILNNKYFMFTLAFLLGIIYVYKIDILFGSMDAHETIKVAETFFSSNKYGSYVMYKGIYAFIPCVISITFGNLTHLSSFILLKIVKSLAFAYITTIGMPFLIEKIFKQKISSWQIYIFIIVIFLLEKGNFFLVSVDLTSFVVFLLCINNLIKLFEKYSNIRCFLLGLLLGISTCLSGQYSVATYIILLYLIVVLIIKYHKEIKKTLIILLILLSGFLITKSVDIAYEKIVVNELREKGAWIPTGQDWFKHGLSAKMTYINFPMNLSDNLGLSLAKYDNEEMYNNLINQLDVYETGYYFKLVLKHPILFIVRWTERLFLGLVNDPLNAFPIKVGSVNLVVAFMGVSLYVLWMYIKENLKKLKQLVSLNSIIFYSFLFTALVPSFGHVENRYYIATRVALIAILLLSPLFRNYLQNIKDKKIKITNINSNFVTCFIFVVICLVAYYAIYSISGMLLITN